MNYFCLRLREHLFFSRDEPTFIYQTFFYHQTIGNHKPYLLNRVNLYLFINSPIKTNPQLPTPDATYTTFSLCHPLFALFFLWWRQVRFSLKPYYLFEHPVKLNGLELSWARSGENYKRAARAKQTKPVPRNRFRMDVLFTVANSTSIRTDVPVFSLLL